MLTITLLRDVGCDGGSSIRVTDMTASIFEKIHKDCLIVSVVLFPVDSVVLQPRHEWINDIRNIPVNLISPRTFLMVIAVLFSVPTLNWIGYKESFPTEPDTSRSIISRTKSTLTVSIISPIHVWLCQRSLKFYDPSHDCVLRKYGPSNVDEHLIRQSILDYIMSICW